VVCSSLIYCILSYFFFALKDSLLSRNLLSFQFAIEYSEYFLLIFLPHRSFHNHILAGEGGGDEERSILENEREFLDLSSFSVDFGCKIVDWTN